MINLFKVKRLIFKLKIKLLRKIILTKIYNVSFHKIMIILLVENIKNIL
jgi:hypothetical protein